jgi:hypothetical protein
MGKLKKIAGKENEVLLDGRMVPVHYDFNMIITTMSSAPDFGSEICENLILVNFELSEEAFEAQMMSIIIQEIDRDLDEE